MIKEGYDHFEITRQEPKVDFCEKKYVFDATKPPNAPRDPVFEASAKCPAYVVPDEVASAVRERQEQEQAEVAKLIERGTPVAKMKTGVDGGMNQVFAARVPGGNTGLSEGGEGQGLALAGFTPAPGTIPSTVNPPRDPGADEAAAATAWTAPAPPAPSRVAASTPSSSSASSSGSTQSGGFFADLVRKVGLASSDTTASTTTAAPAKPKMADAKRSEPPRTEAWTPKTAATKPVEVKQESKQVAAARPAPKPSLAEAPADPATPPAKDTLVAGAQPIVSSNSFESRFSAAK